MTSIPHVAEQASDVAPAIPATETTTDLPYDPELDALAHGGDGGMLPAKIPLLTKVITATAIVLPLIGMVVAMVLLWGSWIGWPIFGIFAVMYTISGFGVTIGYHRLFTHQAFRTSAPIRAVLGVFGSVAVEGPLNWWVATHRCHHQHSDQHGDPHSPNTHGAGMRAFLSGLVHAHLGWLVTVDYPDYDRYIPDLEADPLCRRISALFPLWVALGLLVPAAAGFLFTGTLWGAFLGFLWGGLVRIFLVHHITWSVNSVCHIWGAQPFRSHDHSRNNPIFGILAFGEGWHNNHHAFPASARHGLAWWQIDPSWIVIRTMERLRLVSDVRVPSPERMESKRVAPDAGRRAA